MRNLLVLLLLFPLFASAQKPDANKQTQAKLKAITVPELTFRDASFYDVVDFLVETSKVRDPQGKGVDIVVDLHGAKRPPAITISLRKVSLGDTIQFIADIAGLEMRVQKGLVVLSVKETERDEIRKRLAGLKQQLELPADKQRVFDQAAAEIDALLRKDAPPPFGDPSPFVPPGLKTAP